MTYQGPPRPLAAVTDTGRLRCLPCQGDRTPDVYYDEGNSAVDGARCDDCGRVAVWVTPEPAGGRTFTGRYGFHG